MSSRGRPATSCQTGQGHFAREAVRYRARTRLPCSVRVSATQRANCISDAPFESWWYDAVLSVDCVVVRAPRDHPPRQQAAPPSDRRLPRLGLLSMNTTAQTRAATYAALHEGPHAEPTRLVAPFRIRLPRGVSEAVLRGGAMLGAGLDARIPSEDDREHAVGRQQALVRHDQELWRRAGPVLGRLQHLADQIDLCASGALGPSMAPTPEMRQLWVPIAMAGHEAGRTRAWRVHKMNSSRRLLPRITVSWSKYSSRRSGPKIDMSW